MPKKSAKGAGTIRKKTVTRNGKPYTYWEARVTTGRDPGTGKQIQRSFTGKTQKEVREKMQAAAVEINQGTYTVPSKLTVGQWLDIWQRDYLTGLKPATVYIYGNNIRNHIKPALGAVRLQELHPHMIQGFVNSLDLSPASVRLAYKVLNQALEKAVRLKYIPQNPATGTALPRLEQKEIHPFDDRQVSALLEAVRGGEIENLVKVALFTGMRLSELLGLTWDRISFDNGTVTIDRQLALAKYRGSTPFIAPKNGKSRTITAAPIVMRTLQAQRRRQAERQLRAGPAWSNAHGLVFSREDGSPLEQTRVGIRFSAIAASAGIENARFHDTRHTYAVNAIRAGDDIKTIQGNLGHATAAFTLDRYGHFTEAMQQASAARMEGFVKAVLNL